MFPCPSCGFLVFEESIGSYDICSICDWEDDQSQLECPNSDVGANSHSLKESQEIILLKYPINVQNIGDIKRDPEWRPLTDAECGPNIPKSGLEYFHEVTEKPTNSSNLYYWRNSNDS